MTDLDAPAAARPMTEAEIRWLRQRAEDDIRFPHANLSAHWMRRLLATIDAARAAAPLVEPHIHECPCGVPVMEESIGAWQQGRIRELMGPIREQAADILERHRRSGRPKHTKGYCAIDMQAWPCDAVALAARAAAPLDARRG